VVNREEIIIYDSRNQLVYESGTDYLSVDKATLDQVRLRREVQFRRGDREIVGVLFANGTNRLVVFAFGNGQVRVQQQRNLALILSTGWLLATGLVFLAGGSSPANPSSP
jgi:hypothetical protein